MAAKLIIVFAACVTTSFAQYAAPEIRLAPGSAPGLKSAPRDYSFGYNVQPTHGHSESSVDGMVKGSYGLVEPDGSTRTVDYTADDEHGFRANVQNNRPREGAASYSSAPSYKASSYNDPSYYNQALAYKPEAYAAKEYPSPAAYSAPAYSWRNAQPTY